MNQLSGYEKKEIILGGVKGNLLIIVVSVPAMALLAGLFYITWPDLFTEQALQQYVRNNITWLKPTMPFLILGSLIGGTIMHELLHGLTWARFAPSGFRAIQFGIIWKIMTPYCHCRELLRIKGFKFGVMMPGVVLGFFPLVIGLAAGHVGLYLFGIVFSIAAGGDIAMMYALRHEAADTLVKDHPEQVGCIVFRKKAARKK